MCGITGFFSKNNTNFVSKEELNLMTKALKHRGPDAGGIYFAELVGMGHNRLSILDLSPDANQPMESHSMRYVCVYNGEVYNYREIAKELDIDWKTNCDTEVILEAFSEWGITFINKLNGMFAIAIYDKQENLLYLFRDRVGIKPIYYYWDGENFAFSSELKSLLHVNYIRNHRQLNYSAIYEFLHLGYIPEPNTIYANIKKFPNGQIGIVSENGFRMESYWDIEGAIRRNIITDLNEAKFKLNELVHSSVRMRLISDVPFGTFLSGGIDSSLVTAVASQEYSGKLKTFSIGFEDSRYDESRFARNIANYLGTEHYEYIVTENDAKEIILDIWDFYDEPFADSSAIPTMLLSKMTKKHVSMVLSGDGGDELFHGYGAYKWAKRLNALPVKLFRRLIGNLMFAIPSNRFKRASLLFKYKNFNTIKSHIFSQEQYFFAESELEKILNPDLIFDNSLDQDYTNFVRKLTPEESQAVFDLYYYLKDDLLVKIDRASMRYALETRVPLLDYRIIEFSLNIDPKLKIQKNIQKFILKEILFDHIPREYFDRPKWGFAIPLKKWLANDLSFLMNEYLNEKVINEFNIADFEQVSKLVKRFRSGQDFLYNRIWLLIVLHKFLIKNKELNRVVG